MELEVPEAAKVALELQVAITEPLMGPVLVTFRKKLQKYRNNKK